MRRMLCLALLLAACEATPTESSKKSAAGESCLKSSDCSGELVCIAGACQVPSLADATVEIDGGEGADATTETDTAQSDGTASSDVDVEGASATDALATGDGSTEALSPTDAGDVETGTDAAGASDVAACIPACQPGSCTDGCGGVCSGSCDDGSACTTGDACADGHCQGAAVACDDGNPCTADSCLAATGCSHVPQAGPCDDDNPCTLGDACSDGACASGAPKSCATGDACVLGKCSLITGKCQYASASNAISCDDGSACTAGDVCAEGSCAGTPVVCDDSNSCTSGTCSPTSGCQQSPKTGPCDDGNACTTDDKCIAGTCDPGKPKSCDDGNPCTVDSCSLLTGACQHATAALEGSDCDADGSLCTVGDNCQAGVCAVGPATICDDSNPCTSETCVAATGLCKFNNLTGPCDADGSACTVGDACSGGVCVAGASKSCGDDNPCTVNLCDAASGDCLFKPLPNGTLCDADGTLCTAGDACEDGACASGAPLSCDDGNTCTLDACDASLGCSNKAVTLATSCEADGNLCTSDTCQAGSCKTGTPLGCSDGNPCTDDSCIAATGLCQNLANDDGCSDGDPCTQDDVCQNGACVGAPFACDPCAFMGGTAFSVDEDHVRICSAKLGGSMVAGITVVGGWRVCSRADMYQLAPSKTLEDLTYCDGTSSDSITWLSESCGSGGANQVVFGYNYAACDMSELNSASSYSCIAPNVAARVFVCHD